MQDEGWDKLLSAQEVASMLRVHVETFHRWCRAGQGPVATVLGGGTPRYAASDVRTWLASSKVSSSAERVA
jgi:predicted DNA-binding transcriptional regulator AlpA